MIVCVYVCMRVCRYAGMFIDLLDRLIVASSVRGVAVLWVRVSLYLDVCKCVGLYVCRFACLYAGVCMSVCLYVCMSVYLHVCVLS